MAAVRTVVGHEGLMMALSAPCPELLHSRGHMNKATEPAWEPTCYGVWNQWGREEANVSDAHREKKGGNKVEARVEPRVRNRMANGMRSGWGVWWGTWRGPWTEVIQVSYRHDPMSVGNKQGGRGRVGSLQQGQVCV